METKTRPPQPVDHVAEHPSERAVEHAGQHRVGTDLRFGAAVLGVVILGNLLWHASDAGILTAVGAR